MPVYKSDNGTWYVLTRYLDWKGERKQKCKRGFETRKEAVEWERTFQQQNAADMDTCFVAERDGRLVGVIMAGNDGRRGFIYHTAVHPDYHRQGIGSALVSAALETLRSVGITKVALVVFERNQGGNAFWEKQGFTVRNDLTYRNKALVEMVRKDT